MENSTQQRPSQRTDDNRRLRRRNDAGAQVIQLETMLEPSAGARLSFAHLTNVPAKPAPPETHIPQISRAMVDPEGLEILDFNGNSVVPNTPPDLIPAIQLINENENAARGGFAFVRKLCNLKHAPGWGELWSGITFTQIRPGVYQAPKPGNFIAIKKLNKHVMHRYLCANNKIIPSNDLRHVDRDYILNAMNVRDRENPYREMSRMDEIGDNVHVLGQIEFLQDDDFCYIVMPHACGRRSLDTALFRQDSELAPREARNLFLQILRILAYLEKKGIHHRDLSPDNFIFLEDDQLVAMDLAMSVRIPMDETSGHRTLLMPLGRFGTPAFMAPEIWHNLVFDAVSCDLWSAMLILYAMLTNTPLYRRPDAQLDISFRYYIVARGITQDPINELIQEILGDLFNDEEPRNRDQHMLLTQAQAHLGLTPHANNLFHHFFLVDPSQRWSLAQVMECDFVRYNDD